MPFRATAVIMAAAVLLSACGTVNRLAVKAVADTLSAYDCHSDERFDPWLNGVPKQCRDRRVAVRASNSRAARVSLLKLKGSCDIQLCAPAGTRKPASQIAHAKR